MHAVLSPFSVVYIQSFTAILIGGTHNESLMAAVTTNISQVKIIVFPES